ncbi:MAG: FAD:protein FMN transferase [Acidimicrobiales bacterium]
MNAEVLARTTAMASDVTIRATRRNTVSDEEFGQAMADALEVFHEVERICTRFVATSDLMVLNEARDQWHVVPDVLYRAVEEAYGAHVLTDGRFDPRVHDTLVALGYSRSLHFDERDDVTTSNNVVSTPRAPWRLGQLPARRALHLGGATIDLGGIGKGLAVRWASAKLDAVCDDFLVEAGGDCYCAGASPEGEPWRISVEDPLSGPFPVGVVQVRDRAVTTSSIRLRHWRADGTPVHHLIDPRTLRPGGDGLSAVTVVGHDPAIAEVWSKALFLEGATGIALAASTREIAALWIYEDGSLDASPTMEDYLIWRAP